MPDNVPDTSFIREGRALHEWLLDLISPDAVKRQRAGDALAAMYFGVLSVHSDAEDGDASEVDDRERQQRWYGEVRRSVERPDFPRRAFYTGVAARIIGIQEAYLRELSQENEQFDRLLERLGKRLDTDEPALRQDNQRRLARALCARIERDCNSSYTPEAFTFSGMVLVWLFPVVGPTIIEAPEALWMLIESEHHAHLAYETLRGVGPPAAPLFLDHLIEQFKRSQEDGGDFGDHRALAAVGRGNNQLIEMLLDAIQNWPTSGTWAAAWTFREMGESTREHPRVLHVLLELTSSSDGQRRAAAACALGGVTRGIDDAIDPLLHLTHDKYPDEEEHGGYIVAGSAISALGEIGRQADKVVPRLLELFDTYEEFNPDEGYGGSHSRICRALEGFGPEAAPAIPCLIAHLERSLRKNEDEWWETDVVNLLGSMGPLAIDAVPVLERTDEMLRELDRQEELEWDQDDDDEEFEEDDESQSEERSDIRKAIEKITQQS